MSVVFDEPEDVAAGILPASKAASRRPAGSRITGSQGWLPPRFIAPTRVSGNVEASHELAQRNADYTRPPTRVHLSDKYVSSAGSAAASAASVGAPPTGRCVRRGRRTPHAGARTLPALNAYLARHGRLALLQLRFAAPTKRRIRHYGPLTSRRNRID